MISITVCRNAAGVIGQCLDSVSAQTCEPIEHIAVDGDSSDGTYRGSVLDFRATGRRGGNV